MEMEDFDPKYEFDAPMSFDFSQGEQDEGVDSWFGKIFFFR
jgi:hypothetical protein